VSFPVSSPAPPARQRPSSVTISSYLLFLVAAVLVAGAIASIATVNAAYNVLRSAYAGTPAEGSEVVLRIATIGGAVLSILFAVGLVVLALLNNRGRNPSRIVTWVAGALVLCCNGGELVASSAVNSLGFQQSGANMPDAVEIQRRVDAAMPSWLNPFTIGGAVVVIVATLVALILLALPASNEFFRRAGGDPAMPGYPGYPGYPTYPAYPAAPPAGPAPSAGWPHQSSPGQPPAGPHQSSPGQPPAGPPPQSGQQPPDQQPPHQPPGPPA
jgi:hypothetical protein